MFPCTWINWDLLNRPIVWHGAILAGSRQNYRVLGVIPHVFWCPYRNFIDPSLG
jgi:hypothetical protein